MTNKYPSSSFTSTPFNSHLSTGLNKLMALLAVPMKFHWKNFSQCGNKQRWTLSNGLAKSKLFADYSFRILFLPFKSRNQSIRSVKKGNYRNGTIEMLQQKVSLFVELDKAVLLDKRSPHSTRSCIKFLRFFSSSRLPNQMNRKNLKTNTSKKIADLFKSYISSLFRKNLEVFSGTFGTPCNLLQRLHHQSQGSLRFTLENINQPIEFSPKSFFYADFMPQYPRYSTSHCEN